MNLPRYDVCFAGRTGRCIEVVAGSCGIWKFRFVCGERPIAPGGSVSFFCEVPKFWLAVNLQADDPAADGYLWVTASDDVKFELRDIPKFYKKLCWGRVVLPEGLQPGQDVVFGCGSEEAPAYAIAHMYRNATVSIRVDYFTDGSDHKLWPPIVISVVPGPAAKLAAVLPAAVKPDEAFCLRLRAEDANSNIGAPLHSPVRVVLEGPSGVCHESMVTLGDCGTGVVDGLTVPDVGIYRARVEAEGLRAVSGPMECVAGDVPVRVFWGDLHNHTVWSDGVGTLRENIEYARHKAFIDVFGFAEHVAVTDRYDTVPVDKGGGDWALLGPEMADRVNGANDPGRFATVLGYEYTPMDASHGPDGDHCVFAPFNAWSDLPIRVEMEDLFDAVREAGCIIIPHVGGRTPSWESYPWNAEATPLAEIASMHEHSEWFVQEGLQRGFKLGICGMADGHFGMPGYDCWALHGRTHDLKRRNFSVQSAITAFCVTELTREAVFQAMCERRVYATTGERILLDFRISGSPMGSELRIAERPQVRISVHGTAPIARVDLIRGDRRVATWTPDALDWTCEWEDKAPVGGEVYYYVRVTQETFALAWSSPIWVTFTGAGAVGEEEIGKLPPWNSGPEWPERDPSTCNPARAEDLRRLLERRGIAERFSDLDLVGVFAENRGRFALFRGTDGADGSPVHVHHYFEFQDGRLYISRGHSDYGQYPNVGEWEAGK